MNRSCAAAFLITPPARQIGKFVIAPFKPNVDNAAHFPGVIVRLRSVNCNRKGLRPHRPKKHRRVSGGATKAGFHSNSL
jgi:hypothetical protein